MWASLHPSCLHPSLCFLDLDVYFCHQIRGVFFHYFSNFLLFLFSFWHPYDVNVGTLKVVPEAAYIVLVCLDSFFFLLFWLVVLCFLMFQIIDLILGFNHSSYFPVNCSLFQLVYPLFLTRPFLVLLRSSLNSLSILITSVLNSASDRLLFSTLFSYFPGVLFYSFTWAMLLCLLILAASLCLFLCIR